MLVLVEEYCLGNLTESGRDSEMSVISESEHVEEDHVRATVDTDSSEEVRGQLDSNVAKNANQELDRVQGFAFCCRSIHVGVC